LPSNRNRLLASLKPDELSLFSKHLREVPIEQGELLEERGEPVELVHFPQSGMVSLIVELPGLKKEACSCYEFVTRHVDRLLANLPRLAQNGQSVRR
jgi:CRP-like cAMP-binding protein